MPAYGRSALRPGAEIGPAPAAPAPLDVVRSTAPIARVGVRPALRALARDDAAEPTSARADAAAALFANRELGILAFQRRILEEALDPGTPLLERARYLAIIASNLDEMYMVRVAGLMQQVASGVTAPSPDGLTPGDQLARVRSDSLALVAEIRGLLHDTLLPALAAEGVEVLEYAQLDERQRLIAATYFDEIVFPVLTPLAVDPGRPFPFISNLSLNLGVFVDGGDGAERFARIRVPDTLPRLVPLGGPPDGTKPDGTPDRRHAFVWLEQLVAAHADRLFPGMRVLEVHPFRVTRDARMVLDEIEAEDLLASIESGVRRRRFGSAVRLEVTRTFPDRMRDLLLEKLPLAAVDVFPYDAPLGLSGLAGLAAVDRPELKFPAFVPRIPPQLEREVDRESPFATIRRGDVLLHHPFDSFAPVVEFLRAAARDPDVLAIKQTLYRVGRHSPVVQALLEAVQNGKQVSVLVELKARFDEERNIGWARALEAEGVHVIYGLLGYKTHCKLALVVRREGDRIARYVHLATGNYNAVTAGLYTDLGLLTCDPDIGEDATHLFNHLTGYAREHAYRKLVVAPIDLRARLAALVEREVAHARAGREARLVFKMNALVDPEMILALARAAQAGVRVDLLVRGVSCMRPEIPSASEGVTVTSIVGRFLEHSRIYWFANGGAEEVYLGSADLMPRNLDRRVEVLFPVTDPALVHQVRWEILETYLRDNQRARVMRPDASYERRAPRDGETPVDSQATLLAWHRRC